MSGRPASILIRQEGLERVVPLTLAFQSGIALSRLDVCSGCHVGGQGEHHAPRCHGSHPGEAPDHIAALPTLLITVSILPRLHPRRSYPKYRPWNERVDDFVVPRVGLAFLGDGLCQFG